VPPVRIIARTPRFGAVLPVALAALLLALAAGCAGRRPVPCEPLTAPGGAAAADSLGLAEFLALPGTARDERRAQAVAYLGAARGASSVRDRADALATAAGLAPDDPGPWLALAEIWRWVGDYLQAEACLDRASDAVRLAGEGGPGRTSRDLAAVRTAELRAWLHYDRAEWREGMQWARAAAGLKPGDRDVWRIEGLLAAAQGRHSDANEKADNLRRADMFTTDPAWILAVLDRARGQEESAFARIIASNPRGDEMADLRPTGDHAAECWRDMGIIAERVGQWAWARRWYAESRAALPLGDSHCIREVKVRRLGSPGRASELPVWLAFDRWYVTGSLSSYANLALQRHRAAASPEEKAFWASAVVNATGILLRREDDQAWALRARGLVFAERGDLPRALADLRRAAGQLEAAGTPDGEVEAGLGHVYLLRQDHRAALPHLQRAVALQPHLAPAWSDLGLAQVMAGDRDAAAKAFDRALDLDRGLATAWYNRGLMHLHAGDLDAAAADLGEAARLAPDNQDVARLLQQLEVRRRQLP